VIRGWRMKIVDQTTNRPETARQFDDSAWRPVVADRPEDARQLAADQAAVFRVTTELTQEDIAAMRTSLAIGRIDDEGWVFVNGKPVGEGHLWEESYTFDASQAVHVGRNVIAVVVKNHSGPGGLGGVQWTSSQDTRVRLEVSDALAGVVGQWSRADLAESGWSRQALPERPADAAALLVWHRLDFKLPAAQPGVWAPWLIRLHAKGNGFLYLNGHCLGRLWQRGRETDYCLPECWLRRGPGQKNVVTLCLRRVDEPALIESAVVMPAKFYAERR